MRKRLLIQKSGSCKANPSANLKSLIRRVASGEAEQSMNVAVKRKHMDSEHHLFVNNKSTENGLASAINRLVAVLLD